jgi:hypothetical protein
VFDAFPRNDELAFTLNKANSRTAVMTCTEATIPISRNNTLKHEAIAHPGMHPCIDAAVFSFTFTRVEKEDFLLTGLP